MENKILDLRRVLAHYESCVNTDADKQVIKKSLIDLQNTAYNVANEASKMLSKL